MDLDAGHDVAGYGGEEGVGGGVEDLSSNWDYGGGGGAGSGKSHHHRHTSSCTTYHASNTSYQQQSLLYRFGVKHVGGRGRNGCLQVTSICGMLGSIAFLFLMLVRAMTPSWQSHGGRNMMITLYPGETRQLSPIVTQWDDASMTLELVLTTAAAAAPSLLPPVDTTTGLAMKVYYVPPPTLPPSQQAKNDEAYYNNNDRAHPPCLFSLTGPTVRRQDMFHRELKPQRYQLDSFYLNDQSTLHVEITSTMLGSSSSSSLSSSWTTIYLFQGKAALDWLNGKRPEQSEGAARSAEDGGDEERFWNSALWVQSLHNTTTTTPTTDATNATMAEGGASTSTSNGEPPVASLSLNYTYTSTESDYYSLVYNNDAFWETSQLQVDIDIMETTHDLTGLEPHCILYPTTTTMTRHAQKNGTQNEGGTRYGNHNKNNNRCFWNFHQESDNQEDAERAKRELEVSCIVLQAESLLVKDGTETTFDASTSSNQTVLGQGVGTNNRANDPVLTVQWKSTREWRRFWIAALLPLIIFSLLCHCNSTSTNVDDDYVGGGDGIVHGNGMAKSTKKKKKSAIEDSPFVLLYRKNPNLHNNIDDKDKDDLPSYMVVGTPPVAKSQAQRLLPGEEGMSETMPLLTARAIS